MDFTPIAAAMFGGGVPSFIDLREDVLKPKAQRVFIFQNTFHSSLYFLLWPLVAGAMVWASLQSKVELNALQALYLGFSAPTALAKAIKAGSLLGGGGGPPPKSEN